MKPFSQVLLLTRDPAIQNLVEQVCLIDGYRTVTATILEDVHTLTAQGGRGAFALGVIDTAALGAYNQQQPDGVHQQWQAVTAAYSGLPLVCLDRMSPNGAFLVPRANHRVFLEKPLGPSTFAGMMRMFLTGQ